MSKLMKKYNVKIKAKLQGHPVELSLPVSLSIMSMATSKAAEQALHMNLQDVEFLSVTERPPEYEQLELNFDDDDEDCCEDESEDCCDTQQFDSESSAYTPYTPHPTQAPSTEPEYTSYASAKEPNEQTPEYTSYTSQVEPKEDPLPPTYTPRVNNCYTPYKTRVVPIDSKYTKHIFK